MATGVRVWARPLNIAAEYVSFYTPFFRLAAFTIATFSTGDELVLLGYDMPKLLPRQCHIGLHRGDCTRVEVAASLSSLFLHRLLYAPHSKLLTTVQPSSRSYILDAVATGGGFGLGLQCRLSISQLSICLSTHNSVHFKRFTSSPSTLEMSFYCRDMTCPTADSRHMVATGRLGLRAVSQLYS